MMQHLRTLVGVSAIVALISAIPVAISPVSAQTPAESVPHSPFNPAVPLVMGAGFSEPPRGVDWQVYRTPAGCRSAFTRALRAAAYQRDTLAYTHGPDTINVWGGVWAPLPPDIITTGLQCLRHIPPVSALSSPALLSDFADLAVATNQDSLLQAAVARQLELAGSNPAARANVLVTTIARLVQNEWNSHQFLTAPHVTLAQQYAAQLDALGPGVLHARIEALMLLNAVDGEHQSIDTRIANGQKILQLGRDVPMSVVPASEREPFQALLNQTALYGLWLTYLKTGDHTDYTRYQAAKVAAGIVGENTILGKPAPPVTGDYWFNSPPGGTAVLPAPGTVSLIYLTQPNWGVSATPDENYKLLRELHTQFPALQIILVSTTLGSFRGQDFLDRPDQEAALIHAVLADSFKVPGILAITEGAFRKVSDGHALPMPVPVLEAYHVDPREYYGTGFLIDAQGWVITTGEWSDKLLIQQLLLHANQLGERHAGAER